MAASARAAERPTKGERTTERILDAAETVFSERGFEAASLREIARRAGLQQPGLYNHFASKRDLYAAVLDRALSPLADAMTDAMGDPMGEAQPSGALDRLPAIITDRLLEHPRMAALFQQALQGEGSPGQALMRAWLDRLLAQGLDTARSRATAPIDRDELAIGIVAMFNVTTGYFLSQRVFDSLGAGSLTEPANVERQKALLERVGRAIAERPRGSGGR